METPALNEPAIYHPRQKAESALVVPPLKPTTRATRCHSLFLSSIYVEPQALAVLLVLVSHLSNAVGWGP